LGRFNGAPEIQEEIISKRRNTMNKENKNSEPGTQATALSQKSLDEEAGGGGPIDAMDKEVKKKAQAAPPLVRRATFVVFQQFVMKYAPPANSKEFIADLAALLEARS
jgi:hypothetical protein